jgi:diaminohydroxyphosphoribosylaminopyrimidine deaminase/5-amino-6-(5-phosphoribosylamino)uracil reductase
MSQVLKEAKKGLGYTSPNPLVGALIVKNDKILSKGYHKQLGKEHAEIVAINKINKNELIGSTLYVNLEPCSHYGKTPPCTEVILKSGIKEVIISTKDPDNRVNGFEILKKSGIQVKKGILEKEAKELNSLYFFNKLNKRPYIVLKAALSLDGKIATFTGDSKWISNKKSREIVHKLRLRLKAIAVGKNTIKTDKPKLNCRLNNYTNKPTDKLIFTNDKNMNLNSLAPNSGKIHILNKDITSKKENFIKFCNENEIDSILVEGGGEIYTWFLENNLVDRIFLFYKPTFIGNDGIPVFTKNGTDFIKKLKEFKIVKTETIDNNILIELSNGEPICLLD